MSPRRGTEARLRRVAERPVPGESEARERGWSVVAAAYAERPPASSRPRVLRPLAAAVALASAAAAALLVVAVALTPAGARVGDWIEQRFEPKRESAASSFTDASSRRPRADGGPRAAPGSSARTARSRTWGPSPRPAGRLGAST